MYLLRLLYIAILAKAQLVNCQSTTQAGNMPSVTNEYLFPSMTIPPVSKMRGSIGLFTDYLTLESGTTKWKGPNLEFLYQQTNTVFSIGQAIATSVVNLELESTQRVDVVPYTGRSMLSSPSFRRSIAEAYQQVTKCKTHEARVQAPLCGFFAFLQIVKTKEFIEQANNFTQLNDFFNSIKISADFKTALTSAKLPLYYGHLKPASYAFLWITWSILEAGESFPEVLVIYHYYSTISVQGEGKNSTTCSLKSFDPKTPVCLSSECQASGGQCTTGEYKGCDCVVHATSRPRMISTPWLELQETLVTPLTSCNTDYRSGMDAVSFKTAIKEMCKLHPTDMAVDTVELFQAEKIGLTQYAGIDIRFIWTDKAGVCTQNCVDLFSLFITNMDCNFEPGGMAASGILEQECGRAAFNIFPRTR